MITRTLATAATLAALLATPALAQHQHGQSPADSAEMGGGMQMMHGSMMGGSAGTMRGGMMGMMQSMHPQPHRLLAAADALDLTEDQQARLRTLNEESAAEHQRHMQAAMAIHREAAQALHGESPDLDAYEEALQEASDHMIQAHLAMTRTALQARDVLTAEQREKLHDSMSMMHQMRSGGMAGGAGHGGHR